MDSLRRFLLVLAVGASLLPVDRQVQAQTYPTKPIRLVTNFAGTELVSRILAAKLSPALGEQVVIDPRFGAGGNIGHVALAKAAPDGYTLMIGGLPTVINPHLNPNVGFHPLRDFAAVAQVATIPQALVVHPSVPARSVREFLQLARKSPGKLTYASSGVGSSSHVAAELLKSVAKIDMVHVPYKSATVGLVGALSGDVDSAIVIAPSAALYVKQGKLRGLVVLDRKRVALLPDVPTSVDAGIPEVIATNWYVLLAPAGTPRAIIERLNVESIKAMASPESRERVAALGAEIVSGTPEQAAEFMRVEFDRLGKVIRDAGIKAE